MPRRVAIAFTIVVLLVSAYAATAGTFGGTVVQGAGKNPPGKWVYIKARPGTLRRVEVSKARFDYAASIPRAARSAIPVDDLKDGTLVRVTAEQDGAGEWVAQSVLILRIADQQVLRSSR